MSEEQLREAALEYHRLSDGPERSRSRRPRRWPTSATCRSPIRRASRTRAWRSQQNPARSRAVYTSRGNLVAVITNGTAVLGLGNIGALAGKPVMEGKGCLFKKFAGIDVFDIEIDETDPDKLVEIIAGLEPTFGGINLEDIKAPECFYIETQAARADEDPGVPRRPARHRDRRGRGRAQRAQDRRQGHRQGEARVLRRGRRRDRLPRPAGEPRPRARRTSSCSTARAWSTRAAPKRWTPTRRATRRTRARARWPTSSRAPTSFSACRRAAC